MDNIYVNLGGYNIKIGLAEDKKIPHKLDYLRKRLETELFIYLRNFVVLSKPRKIDFEIIFSGRFETEIIKFGKNSKEYMPIIKWEGEKRIITHYMIGLFQFEIILRRALHTLLTNHGGFTIHGSSAKIGNKAYLFLGKSGAGKSTIAELLNDVYPTISDDTTAIKKDGKRYFVFQTPFLEKAWWIKKSQKVYELDKVFFINKSKTFSTDKASDKEFIIEKALTQLADVQKIDRKSTANLIKFAISFNNFYNLHFDRDAKKTINLIGSI